MRISYQLEEFSEEACDQISSQLRSRQIPHLLENKLLLIDKVDESEVESVLADLGNVEEINRVLDSPTFVNADHKIPKMFESLRINQNRAQQRESPKHTEKPEDEPGTLAILGGLAGGGLGVYIVIQAFSDPTYEGRVYLFLPAIILGSIGFYGGYAVEKGIRKTKKKW